MGRATLMTEFSQTTYYDFCKKEKPCNDKLHRLYFQELADNVAWIKRRYPKCKPQDDMSLYDISLILGLDWDNFGKVDGSAYTKDTPEAIVRYFLREKKLKSQKLEDIAEYLLQRDIRSNIDDDLDEFIEMEKRVKRLLSMGKNIPLKSIAIQLGIERDSMAYFVRRIRLSRRQK